MADLLAIRLYGDILRPLMSTPRNTNVTNATRFLVGRISVGSIYDFLIRGQGTDLFIRISVVEEFVGCFHSHVWTAISVTFVVVPEGIAIIMISGGVVTVYNLKEVQGHFAFLLRRTIVSEPMKLG